MDKEILINQAQQLFVILHNKRNESAIQLVAGFSSQVKLS